MTEIEKDLLFLGTAKLSRALNYIDLPTVLRGKHDVV